VTVFRSENVLVGLVALGLVPWIGWTMARGMRDGRLPIGRAFVHREERAGPFYLLLALYAVAMIGVAAIGADLLLGLGFRN
jgi:hypothetical protein